MNPPRGAPELTRDDPSAFSPPPAFGPFRVLHQVGVGALGPVFRTYEPTRDRLVAVKVFKLDITPEQAGALADELSKAADAGLFHPSIVEPIASGVEGTVAYRADEYVAAETLDVAMRHYAPAPIEKVLPFITQLAGAIDFARSAGVTHGALHPRDVFVTPEEARASGFGVVEALERVGLRAPVRRPYTAPERIAGGTWGAPADVFSLGVIAYELLTARRPSGTGAQLAAITGGEHAAAIHAVIVQAMNEDPARRFQSALAFASALDAASRGEMPAGAASRPTPASMDISEGRLKPAPTETRLKPAPTGDVGTDPGRGRLQPALTPPAPTETERVEPVNIDQEEADFRVSEPELDDIAAERDEDDAHDALTQEERRLDDARLDAGGDRSLFDDEALEDLAIQPAASDTERFADEFAAASSSLGRGDELDLDSVPAFAKEDRAFADPTAKESRAFAKAPIKDEPGPEHRRPAPIPRTPAAPVRAVEASPAVREPAFSAPPSLLGSYTDESTVVHERRGPGLGSVVVIVALALLVGFAAGYAVRGRTPAPPAAGDAAPPVAAAPDTAKPQPYSEQAVTSSRPSAADTQKPSPVPPTTAPEPAPTSVPAPAPAKPAPVATTGTVEVRSSPSGAGVTLNGRWRGRTPLTLEDVRFGRHTVRVVQPGYTTGREEVTVSAATPRRELSFRLQKAAPPPAPAKPAARSSAPPAARSESFTGSIYVDSRPRGARVLIDGKFMGNTPVRIPDLSVGSHIVRLQLEDHRDWTTSTRVTAAGEARVSGSLERIR